MDLKRAVVAAGSRENRSLSYLWQKEVAPLTENWPALELEVQFERFALVKSALLFVNPAVDFASA